MFHLKELQFQIRHRIRRWRVGRDIEHLFETRHNPSFDEMSKIIGNLPFHDLNPIHRILYADAENRKRRGRSMFDEIHPQRFEGPGTGQGRPSAEGETFPSIAGTGNGLTRP